MIDILPRPDIKGKTPDAQAKEINDYLTRFRDVLENILETLEKKIEENTNTE